MIALNTETKEPLSHPDKPLLTHLRQVRDIGLSCLNALDVSGFPISRDCLASSLAYILFYHDLGKATPFFQDYLRAAIEGKKYKGNRKLTQHALISACYTAWAVHESIADDQWSDIMAWIAFVVARRHHGNLEEQLQMSVIEDEEWDLVESQWKTIPWALFGHESPPDFDSVRKYNAKWVFKFNRFNKKNHGFDLYFLANLFFSILTYSDKTDVVFGSRYLFPSLAESWLWVDSHKQRAFSVQDDTPMNRARESIYSLSLESLRQAGSEEMIYVLNAPTGSGKTLAAINLAFDLTRADPSLRRVVYALPFTSIIDQTALVVNQLMQSNQLENEQFVTVHHHLSEPDLQYEETRLTPDQAEMLVENWEKPIVLTTFWQLFHSLISGSNAQLRKFHQMGNAVVILDEIQSLPFEYWSLIRDLLPRFCRLFHTRIILMSATMPLLFPQTKGSCRLLLGQEEQERLFNIWNRYRLHIIEKLEVIDLETVMNHFLDNFRDQLPATCLFIFNTIDASIRFFKMVSETLSHAEIIYLSSNIVPIQRRERLARIKARAGTRPLPPLIVVSTQLVEAGVDLDFDSVYRDLAPLDSLVQAAGRCNRNAHLEFGDCFIFQLSRERNGARKPDCQYIYSPLMLDATRTILLDRPVWSESDIHSWVRRYYGELERRGSSAKSSLVAKAMQRLEYSELFREFRIIQDYIPSQPVFIELDGNARSILSRFQQSMQIENRFERQNVFLSFRQDFYNCVVSPYLNSRESFDDLLEIGGFRIVPFDQLRRYYHPDFGWIGARD